VEIAWEVAKTHPIRHGSSLTPSKIHIDQTSPFWKQLRRRCHPPTTPNNVSPSGYCLHFKTCGNCSRTCGDTSNQEQAFPYTS
jgi:hypothetical protein